MRKRIALGLLLSLASLPAAAQSLLPNAKQTFVDGNGQPLAAGQVFFYIPNSTTSKTTWQNQAETLPNPQPILLDSSGRAQIWGNGSYREVVKDVFGNLIWDQITSESTFIGLVFGGTSGGQANAQTLIAPQFVGANGQQVNFFAGFTNTGATSLTVNGISGAVVKDTAAGSVSLIGEELFLGNQESVVWNAAGGVFHLSSYPASPLIGQMQTVASATTVDLGLIPTHYANITGTTLIASFGSTASTASPFYLLQFSGIMAIIDNPSNILTPDGQNITTFAGATAFAIYQGSGLWLITGYSGVFATPSGSVQAFNLASCPTGWIPSDGNSGTADLRGYFVRGLDTGGTIDPARTLGSFQADSLKDHTHVLGIANTGTGGTSGLNGSNSTGTNQIGSGTVEPPNNGGTETRPKNVALLYCQKS